MQKEMNKLLREKQSNDLIVVEYLRGGTIKTVSELGCDKLKPEHFDKCYPFTGVNNFTRKVGKRCVLRANSVIEAEQFIISEITNAYLKLSALCPKVVICHLIGLDIATYNKAPCHSHERDQHIINETVNLVNVKINKMNIDHNVKGPWLADTIHSTSGNHTTHKYKMLPDGLHPDEKTLKIWAKKIVASLL